jgi:hypothetical protein
MKSTFSIETKSLEECKKGDLFYWDKDRLALLGEFSDKKRLIIDLDKFTHVVPTDGFGKVSEMFQCLPVVRGALIDLASYDSIDFATNAKLGDICIEGRKMMLVCSTGSPHASYLLDLATGDVAVSNSVGKVLIFKAWTILVPKEHGLNAFVLKKHPA